MEGPRVPNALELTKVIDFLNLELRSDSQWSIAKEYPTALSKSNIHNMRIVTEGSKLVAHSLLKPHIVKTPHLVLKVGAIGSVVTHPDFRGQGHSTATVKACLNEALNQSCELAVLWSDKPDFYGRMGFRQAGVEDSFVISSALQVGPSKASASPQLQFKLGHQISAEAILRLYQKHTCTTYRTVDEIRLFLQIPNAQVYTAWSTTGMLEAFAIEGKGADLKDYVHEWGGSSVSALMSLFNFILLQKKKAFVLIAPQHSMNLKLQLIKSNIQHSQGYLGLIKILKRPELIQKINKAQAALSGAPIKFDHLSDEDLTEVLFGPWSERISSLVPIEGLKSGLLPLCFWLWGWDSI